MHKSTLHLGLRFLQPATIRHGLAAHGQEQFLRLQRLRLSIFVFEGYCNAFGILLHGFDGATRENLNAFFLKRLGQFHGNLFVFDRHNARQRFQDGHLSPERIVDGRKLHAYRAGPNYNQGLRDLGKLKNRTVRENRLVVGFNAGERFRLRPAHHQDIRRLNLGFLPVLLHAHASRAFILSPALHPFDLVLLEQKLDAFRMLLDDFVFSRQDIGPIDFQPADLEPQLRAILELIVNLGVMEQHFGGNAADVQASPAEIRILFHHHRLQSKFASTDRRHIPARTTPDNRHIVLCHS